MTLLAGKFTPAAKVIVAAITRIDPDRNPVSTVLRSSPFKAVKQFNSQHYYLWSPNQKEDD